MYLRPHYGPERSWLAYLHIAILSIKASQGGLQGKDREKGGVAIRSQLNSVHDEAADGNGEYEGPTETYDTRVCGSLATGVTRFEVAAQRGPTERQKNKLGASPCEVRHDSACQ